jgi:hypothetical protein
VKPDFRIATMFSRLNGIYLNVFILVTSTMMSSISMRGQNAWDFEYIGVSQSVEIPSGRYLLQVWGAQGGHGHSDAPGGKGGYSSGEIEFSEPTTIKVFVGGAGEAFGAGGFNGGGAAGSNYGAEGGGASDIRIYPYDLESRIIVGGGGGGGTFGTYPTPGGAGGGLEGIAGTGADGYSPGQGGTQTSGGETGCCFNNTANGTFGQGASSAWYHNAGGGGGWYGGGSGVAHASAGGGSGYVGSLNNTEMISGNEAMPNPQGDESLILGNEGNGFVRITSLFGIQNLITNNATCHDSNDGYIAFDIFGGTAPFSIHWQNDTLTAIDSFVELSELASGGYTLIITDSEGLAFQREFEIGPDSLEIEIELDHPISCDSFGAALASASGGAEPYTFEWNTGEESPQILNKAVGIYSLIVSDSNGCIAEEDIVLSPLDSVPPQISLNNMNLYLDEDGLAAIEVCDIDCGTIDDCFLAEMSLSQSSFDCSNADEEFVTATFTATDLAGNTSESEFKVTVIDTLAPQVRIKSVVLELDDEGKAILTISDVDEGSFDNCAISEMGLSKTHYSCKDLGVNQEWFSATDIHGNESYAILEVEVVDLIGPSIQGPVLITLCEGDQFTLDAYTVKDNCGYTLNILDGPEIGSSPPSGLYSVLFMASDNAGNSVFREITLNVQTGVDLDLGEDLEVSFGEEVTLDAGQFNQTAYSWRDGTEGAVNTFTATASTHKYVVATSESGCTYEDQIFVHVVGALFNTNSIAKTEFDIFPNPSSGFVNLRIGEVEGDIQVAVLNMEGREVLHWVFDSTNHQTNLIIDLSLIPDGAYILQIQTDSQQFSRKLIKS